MGVSVSVSTSTDDKIIDTQLLQVYPLFVPEQGPIRALPTRKYSNASAVCIVCVCVCMVGVRACGCMDAPLVSPWQQLLVSPEDLY